MTDNKALLKQKLDYIKASYQLKYGMEMDDWSAVNLAESRELFEMVKSDLFKATQESRRLHQTFKGSVKPIHFASGKQAFVYGLGICLPYGICALVLGTLLFFYLRNYGEYKKIREYVSAYENVESYVHLIRYGEISIVSGEEVLVLKPKTADNTVFGQCYVFDPKRKEVHVPLRKLK